MARVLVVDDVIDNITLLTFDLEDDGFTVIPAHSGAECLERAAVAPRPDIILLDIHMPGLSGVETLKRLKQQEETQDIPVIMVSADQGDHHTIEAIDCGAHDYVTKPIEYPVLAARMRSALRLTQALKDLEKANAELHILATTDALTNLNNRRQFFKLSKAEVAKKSRNSETIAVMMLDIDHFKQINDKYGHDVGDKALQAFSKLLLSSLREYDIVGRLGGEEFAICSPHADIEGSKTLSERILSGCRAIIIESQNGDARFTTSIGLTEVEAGENFEEALRRADALLYEAKVNGRDQLAAKLKNDS